MSEHINKHDDVKTEPKKPSKFSRAMDYWENNTGKILVVESAIIIGAIAFPKVRREIAGYRRLQLDATEAKLAVYALAGKLLVDDEAHAVVEAVETATS